MGLLGRFGKAKYDDSQIVSRVMRAIEEDPMCMDPGQVVVSAKDGVITLTGSASTETEKAHLEGVARSAVTMAGLKFAEIVNQVTVAS